MRSKSIQITLPDDLGLSEEQIKQELAVALFERQVISLARAATLAGMSRLEFQRLLADRSMPIHYDFSDFAQDVENLRQLGRLP